MRLQLAEMNSQRMIEGLKIINNKEWEMKTLISFIRLTNLAG